MSTGPDKFHCTILKTAQKYYLELLRSTRRLAKDESSDSYKGEELRKMSYSLTVQFVPVFSIS